MRAASLSIVLLFYNEEECVRQVLEEVRDVQPQAEIIAARASAKARRGFRPLAEIAGKPSRRK